MEIESPLYLLLFSILPFLFIWYQKKGKNYEALFLVSSKTFLSKKILKAGSIKNNILTFSYFIILVLIILGLSRPRIVDRIKETSIEVVDMVLVLDISSSMLASDFKPNRLEAVKKTAIEFVGSRKSDRIGIIVFAGESFIQCPLTVDKSVLKSLINEISIVSEEYDGTAIGMAIANATNRLRKSNVKSKVMVLLSDGSNNSGQIDPKSAAEIASQYDIKIYTIGAGTNQDFTRIPGRGLIKNEIDEETLQFIAKKTGGKFFRATDIQALENIYSEIDNLERSEIEVKEYTNYSEMYIWILFPSLMIGLLTEFFKRNLFRTPW